MSRNLKKASLISLAATVIATLISAASSGAAAEGRAHLAPTAELSSGIAGAAPSAGTSQLETRPVPTELRSDPPASDNRDAPDTVAAPAAITAASLQVLVAAQPAIDEPSPELKCLASAIYFEARSESLSGQLAVGRVIVNRTRSGRFPNSYCGVVYQPSQFSFVHGAAIRAGLNPRLWHNALAIAQIAHDGSWQSEAEGALYFHAARVAPAWHLRRIAQIDNHIFYR